jgi:hypothetical protein
MAMLDDPAPILPKVRGAVETLARRTASLHRFGESYRALARLPAPSAERIPLPGLSAIWQHCLRRDGRRSRLRPIFWTHQPLCWPTRIN